MALVSLGLGRSCGLLVRPTRASHAVQPWRVHPSRAPASQPSPHQRTTCESFSGSGGYGSTAQKREALLDTLRRELKTLEDERDQAVSTAESCAKTCVRLTDMSRLLEDLALEKVKAGDEAGAKVVLQEKNSLKEIIDKSNSKAQANFALAGKLAALIGDKHNELVALLGGPAPAAAPAAPASTSYTGAGRAGGASSYGAAWPQPSSSSSSTTTSSGYDSGYGSSSSSAAAGASGGSYQMPWEKSLQDAQQRVRQAEAEAQRMGRLAALSAEDSIQAARERLADRPGAGRGESILQARERLRRSAEESIAEARERLRAQDTQILEYCRRIVARYRRGEYVSEDELEFAFEQLERRLL